MGSWVGPWVPFSKLSRQKAIETCEILIEQRDRQIRRAEAAEARLAEVEGALDDELANLATDGARPSNSVVRRIEAIVRPAARGEGDRPTG